MATHLTLKKLLLVTFAAVAPLATASPPEISSWTSEEPTTLNALTNGVPAQRVLCGDQYYDPLQYTCFDQKFLCPWQNGYPMNRCGVTDKCYSPFRYGCDNGKLLELPLADGPFELFAINLRNLAYVKVHECGFKFWLKEGRPCTLCPPRVGDACPPGVDTVFNPGRSLNTMVPGGQRYYVEPTTGALQASTPHSGVDPEGAIYDITAIQNGTFGIAPNDGWMACPSPLPGTVEAPDMAPTWQIFAQLPELKFDPACVPMNLVSIPWKPSGNNTFAAWEYV